MKILCVADHIDPLVYSPTIKQRFGHIDMVLSAGDLPMEYLGFISSGLNRTVAFVFGNHNLRELPLFSRAQRPILDTTSVDAQTRNYYGATCLENRLRKLDGLLVAGLGGSMRYNAGDHQFTDAQMYTRIFRLIPRLLWNRVVHGRYLDILLTHAPPQGVQDRDDLCHRGFAAFLWFMKVFEPRYLLHGHIHLYDINANRSTQYLNTTVINVYDHYVLEMEDTDAPAL